MRWIARGLAHAMAAACVMIAAGGAQAQAAAAPADRILVNGTVLTMDGADTVAQAIAIRGERIVAVGTNPNIRRLAGPATEVIDLGGRTVIPGLIDTHIHAIRGGQSYAFETYWYEGETTSLAAGLEQLRKTALARGPGKWVAVTGSWHPDQFTEKRAPTPAELTALLPGNPAYVQYLYDYALVNARAIEVLELDQPDALPPRHPHGARPRRPSHRAGLRRDPAAVGAVRAHPGAEPGRPQGQPASLLRPPQQPGRDRADRPHRRTGPRVRSAVRSVARRQPVAAGRLPHPHHGRGQRGRVVPQHAGLPAAAPGRRQAALPGTGRNAGVRHGRRREDGARIPAVGEGPRGTAEGCHLRRQPRLSGRDPRLYRRCRQRHPRRVRGSGKTP
ncbi:exported hypothetical protein [Cupriavidus taiwanensis]|nr:exported hypothetical protein [Cupriavidus taiwanensis]